MDISKLTLSKSDFENYISSTELDKIEKEWLVSWNNYDSKIESDVMLPLIRCAHYWGFMQGALAIVEGKIK
jgi:hypothetical protein